MKFVLIFLVLQLSLVSCAGLDFSDRYSAPYHEEVELLKYGNISEALKEMSGRSDGHDVDAVLYSFQLGILYHRAGEYKKSNQYLEMAKKKNKYYRKISISEKTGSFLTNDKANAYVANNYEMSWLYFFKMLNYLHEKDLDGMRVELNQLNDFYKTIEKEELSKLAMFNYFAGNMYELLQDKYGALIEYRKAYNLSQENSIVIKDYARSLVKVGRMYELNNLINKHNLEKKVVMRESRNVFCLKVQQKGIVDSKYPIVSKEVSGGSFFDISIPNYRNSYRKYSRSNRADTFVENIQKQVRDIFKGELPQIIIKTIARVALKSAGSTSDNKGVALVSVLLMLTESADLRSINFLPAYLLLEKSHENSEGCVAKINNSQQLDSTFIINSI